MDLKRKKYLIVLAGPTAVGKTDLSIQLAKNYGSVIISADSRQFYRELSIGTAKPTEDQLSAVPHYFINNKNIDELYGAGHFANDVVKALPDLYKTHEVIFMTGGSGLYIDAVLNGVDDFIEVPQELRNAINNEYNSRGLEWLRSEVSKADNEYFESVDKNNPQRLIRALEIFRSTGRPFSSYLTKRISERDFTPIKILLNLPREELYARINRRVDEMMTKGLLEEVRSLAAHKEVNALKTVGYKELFEHLEGKYSLEYAVDKIKQHTRNYAKRQLTWFRNKDTFVEFDPRDTEGIKQYISEIVKNG